MRNQPKHRMKNAGFGIADKRKESRLLDKLVSFLSDDDPEVEIKELLQKHKEQQEASLTVMTRLEKLITQGMMNVWGRI